MPGLVSAASPILAMLGQIAAIVISLFVLIFVLLAVGFNLLMVFAMTWVSEQINLIKMLRPTVESINKASESVSQGVAPAASENPIVRRVASLPTSMHAIDEKVEQSMDSVSKAMIEFRARTVQAQTIMKVFFLPGLIRSKPVLPIVGEVLEGQGPDHQIVGPHHLEI